MTQPERWLVETAVIAEPVIYVVAALAFISASALLVWKTTTPGRLLILSSMIVLATTVPLGWYSSSTTLTPSIVSFAASKLAVAVAAMLCAFGYGRMVLHVFKSSHASKQS
jgi:hypothetical protein